MEQEEAQQIEKEMQVYLEEYSESYLVSDAKRSESMEPDVKVQTETASGERIWTGIAGMESRSAKGISRCARKADSMEDLVFLQGRGTKLGTPLHRIWKPEKARKKVFGRRDQLFHTILRDTVPRMPGRHRQNRKTGGGRSAECSLFCCRQRIHGYSGYISNQNCKENSTNL